MKSDDGGRTIAETSGYRQNGRVEMKRLIVIAPVIFLYLISGCIQSDPIVAEEDLTSYEFDLDISTEKMIFSKEDESINLKLILMNRDDVDIKLETYQIDFPHIEIINPNSFTYTLFHGNITVAPNYELVKKGGEITSIIELKNSLYWNGSSHSAYPIDWEINGKYECQATAYGILSNVWEFEVV